MSDFFDLLVSGGSFGKTSPESSGIPTTPSAVSFQELSEGIHPCVLQGAGSGQILVWLPGHGHGSVGGFSALNISACPNGGRVFSLSSVLEMIAIPPRLYLSAKAASGILRRAQKRGRSLMPILAQALVEAGAQTVAMPSQGISSLSEAVAESIRQHPVIGQWESMADSLARTLDDGEIIVKI
jgi:hypothetical protein